MTKLTVTTANPLSPEKKKELEKAFAARYGEFSVTYLVNDELVGGMVLFDGDKIYDGSVAGQLERFRDRKGNA